MSCKKIQIDRNVLYAEVWSTPMSRLAEQYGLSDVGLKKIWKKLQVPTPGSTALRSFPW